MARAALPPFQCVRSEAPPTQISSGSTCKPRSAANPAKSPGRSFRWVKPFPMNKILVACDCFFLARTGGHSTPLALGDSLFFTGQYSNSTDSTDHSRRPVQSLNSVARSLPVLALRRLRIMISIDEAFIESAAPNSEAAKNGRGLVLKGKFLQLYKS